MKIRHVFKIFDLAFRSASIQSSDGQNQVNPFLFYFLIIFFSPMLVNTEERSSRTLQRLNKKETENVECWRSTGPDWEPLLANEVVTSLMTETTCTLIRIDLKTLRFCLLSTLIWCINRVNIFCTGPLVRHTSIRQTQYYFNYCMCRTSVCAKLFANASENQRRTQSKLLIQKVLNMRHALC